MKIETHPDFNKHYKKRILGNKKLMIEVEKRISLFKNDPRHPILKDHGLVGSKSGLRSFSVSGDIRIIYRKLSYNHVLLLDIGSHNQVY